MKGYVVLAGMALLAGIALAACGDGGSTGEAPPAVNPADFQSEIDNPLSPFFFPEAKGLRGGGTRCGDG